MLFKDLSTDEQVKMFDKINRTLTTKKKNAIIDDIKKNLEIKKEIFEVLVQQADSFLNKYACPTIKMLRNNDKNNVFDADKLLSNKYVPLLNSLDEIIDYRIILKRFCVQLQNYQARPIAINYMSYSFDVNNNDMLIDLYSDNNKLYKSVLNYFIDNPDVIKKSSKIKQNELEKKIKHHVYYLPLYYHLKKDPNILFYEDKKIEKNSTWYNITKDLSDSQENGDYYYNYAWDIYARGLMDVLILIQDKNENYKDGGFVGYIKHQINSIYENIGKFSELTKIINNFKKDIYSLGDALTYDFFKELCCKKLVKADVHINAIFKEFKLVPDFAKENDVASIFMELCGKKYEPYEIDKKFWLCSTGQFYADGININILTRKNFIEYIKHNTDSKIDEIHKRIGNLEEIVKLEHLNKDYKTLRKTYNKLNKLNKDKVMAKNESDKDKIQDEIKKINIIELETNIQNFIDNF